MLDVTPMSLDQRDSPRPTPTLKDADRLLAGSDIGATVVTRPQPTVVTALVIGCTATRRAVMMLTDRWQRLVIAELCTPTSSTLGGTTARGGSVCQPPPGVQIPSGPLTSCVTNCVTTRPTRTGLPRTLWNVSEQVKVTAGADQRRPRSSDDDGYGTAVGRPGDEPQSVWSRISRVASCGASHCGK